MNTDQVASALEVITDGPDWASQMGIGIRHHCLDVPVGHQQKHGPPKGELLSPTVSSKLASMGTLSLF